LRLPVGRRGVVGFEDDIRTVDIFIPNDLRSHIFFADLLELDGGNVLVFLLGHGDAENEHVGLVLDLFDDAHIVDLVVFVEVQIVDLTIGVVDRLLERLEALCLAEGVEGSREIEVVPRHLFFLLLLGTDMSRNREQQEAR
jgi:hypothetical protein